jgi:hypothetical protein
MFYVQDCSQLYLGDYITTSCTTRVSVLWFIPPNNHAYIPCFHTLSTHSLHINTALQYLHSDLVMSTIKLNHIELLVGPLNHDTWRRRISQVLQGKGYWGHVDALNSTLEGETNQLAPR